VEFQERFPDDAACLAYLAACRWPDGFRCPVCDGGSAWVLERRRLWECAECHRQTSVTAGTVLHGTRTSLRLWFWAAYLVATHTPGISALQLQRQLGISRYETAWLILQKLRRAMVAPEREPLRGEVEVDETLVGGVREGRHVARRHGEKVLVGIIVEVRGAGSGRLRLQVLPDASANTLTAFVSTLVAPGAIVHTDGWRGYRWLASAGYDHRPRLGRRDHPDAQKLLPRAHRAASNLKTWLQGTHHGVSAEHLHVYLDEFVFRHNRRSTPMAAFQTLLGLGALHAPTTYRAITRPERAAA
jgi:transposase-like protein